MNGALKYLSTLSFSEAILAIAESNTKDESLSELYSEAIKQCKVSSLLEPKALSKKDIARIFNKHKEFEKNIEDSSAVITLCFILLVLEDILLCIKEGKRYHSVQELCRKIMLILEKLDEELDSFNDYENAKKLNIIWKRI